MTFSQELPGVGLATGSQLEQDAEELASEHHVGVVPRPGRKQVRRYQDALARLQDLRSRYSEPGVKQNVERAGAEPRASADLCNLLANGSADRASESPIAVWLSENLLLGSERSTENAGCLPDCDDEELPRLNTGELAGFPRIYAVARLFTIYVNNLVEINSLKQFLLAYQRVSPLDTNEIREMAAMLRLALAENLMCIVEQALPADERSGHPDPLAARFLEKADLQLSDPVTIKAKVTNALASLRLIASIHWTAFNESISPVDHVLGEDPGGIYPLMDYATRDYYRTSVGQIAKRLNLPERRVAEVAVELASEPRSSSSANECLGHVGYYLIDEGRNTLYRKIGYRQSWRERISQIAQEHPAAIYLWATSSITALALSLCLFYASSAGASLSMLVCLTLLLIVPLSEFAAGIPCAFISKPPLLPRMDYSCGVPPELKTMVVIPAIFSSEANVSELIGTLEAHYLANQDDNIFFAILGDWADAPQEKQPNDDVLLSIALSGIKELNAKYRRGRRDRFYLFHRRRCWSSGEEAWIGWERKRGKLREFNRLLRGARDTTHLVNTADEAFLAQIRYVITLDSDTLIPRDAARKLIATISHPLNRPRIDAAGNRIVRGYAIIQPQLRALPPCPAGLRIPKIFSNHLPFDQSVLMPLYLDQYMYGHGGFVGKGLYDVDAFEIIMKDHVPEDMMLSHDTHEGLYARPGLAVDIVLADGAPLHIEGITKVVRRWTRGNWQLLPWLAPRVRNAQGQIVRNVLSSVARWKIADMLRRSMFGPSVLLWLIAAWIVLPGSPLLWTLLAVTVLVLSPRLLFVKMRLRIFIRELPRVSFARKLTYLAGGCISYVLLLVQECLGTIIFLPFQSYVRVDAAARGLYRLMISHKHMLEWTTSSRTLKDSRHNLPAFIRLMWSAIAIALASGVLIYLSRPAASPAAPFLISWIASPWIACWLNSHAREGIIYSERRVEHFVRLNMRRMWHEIEQLASQYDRRLHSPPAVQNDVNPVTGYASQVFRFRQLFWIVAASDLGCIGKIEMAERLDRALTALKDGRRFFTSHHGDDDMQKLRQVVPRHLMDAENGNLAGAYTAIGDACRENVGRPILGDRVINGLSDVVALIKAETANVNRARPAGESITNRQICDEVLKIEAISSSYRREEPHTLTDWNNFLAALAHQAGLVIDQATTPVQVDGAGDSGLRYWVGALIRQIGELERDLRVLTPWVSEPMAQLIIRIGNGINHPVDAGEWKSLSEALDRVPTISGLAEEAGKMLNRLRTLRMKYADCARISEVDRAEMLRGFDLLAAAIEESAGQANSILSFYSGLARQSEMIMGMTEYRALLDEEYKLNCSRLDPQ